MTRPPPCSISAMSAATDLPADEEVGADAREVVEDVGERDVPGLLAAGQQRAVRPGHQGVRLGVGPEQRVGGDRQVARRGMAHRVPVPRRRRRPERPAAPRGAARSARGPSRTPARCPGWRRTPDPRAWSPRRRTSRRPRGRRGRTGPGGDRDRASRRCRRPRPGRRRRATPRRSSPRRSSPSPARWPSRRTPLPRRRRPRCRRRRRRRGRPRGPADRLPPPPLVGSPGQHSPCSDRQATLPPVGGTGAGSRVTPWWPRSRSFRCGFGFTYP